MTNTSRIWDQPLQAANLWLRELSTELGWADAKRTLVALRSVLHALRDRLPPDEAVQLAAELPLLIKGVYYDGWNPSNKALKVRSRSEFLEQIGGALQRGVPNADAEEVTRAVLRLIAHHVSEGEMGDIRGILPSELAELLPAAPVAT